MLELDEMADQIKYISNQLDEIRTLSKGCEDFYDAPYDNDYTLIQKILEDRIQQMLYR